jgi:hypothetical protein
MYANRNMIGLYKDDWYMIHIYDGGPVKAVPSLYKNGVMLWFGFLG